MAKVSEELIEAACQGDEKALGQLLAVCQPDLRRYARRVCATEDIEDAVQDALIVLYRRIGALRTLAAFTGWIFKIVKRECQRLMRRGLNRQKDAAFAAPDIETGDHDLRLDLIRIIGGLPPIYRDAMICRDINELSAEETAIKVGASVDAVKSRLHRARYLIRQQLLHGAVE